MNNYAKKYSKDSDNLDESGAEDELRIVGNKKRKILEEAELAL